MLDGVVRRGLEHATQSLGEAIMWHGVILFMCISGPADDAPEPHRLQACAEIKSQAPHAIDATSSP